MNEQRCQTCRHFSIYPESSQGRCLVPLPESVLKHFHGITFHMYRHEGIYCKTYEAQP